jgi:hypothetical protein
MKRQRLLKSVMLGVAICSLLAVGAYAQRGHYYPVRLPGVDHHGNLSSEYGAHARLKLVCNTHHRTFCATARGHVKNLSGHRQIYHNRIALALRELFNGNNTNIPLSAIQITKDQYTVQKGSLWHHHRASCSAIVCGRINVNGGGGYPNGPA